MPLDYTWPLFFASKPLNAARIKIAAGDAFPIQDRTTIRGFGAAYGVKDPDRVPFNELGYVTVLNVHTEEMRRHILERGLTYTAAKELVGG